MNSDDLQRWASILRWVGLSITGVGVAITFFSHFVADKLLVVQKGDKAKAQERLRITEQELAETKAKTLSHGDILSYRTVTAEQRQAFIKATKELPKGRLFVIAVQGDTEAYKYAEAINEMLFAAGYEPTKQLSTVGNFGGPTTGITAGIASEENKPAFSEPLILALQGAGFPVQPIIVSGAASRGPEYVHITVGSKPR